MVLKIIGDVNAQKSSHKINFLSSLIQRFFLLKCRKHFNIGKVSWRGLWKDHLKEATSVIPHQQDKHVY
jgi:hypothetical protein